MVDAMPGCAWGWLRSSRAAVSRAAQAGGLGNREAAEPAPCLSDEEREVLERWARRPKSAQALALRCRIVLAAADGESSKEIAARLGCNRSTVGRWRGRFAGCGLDGLHDEPRPGRPRSIGDDDVERVIVKTLEEQPA